MAYSSVSDARIALPSHSLPPNPSFSANNFADEGEERDKCTQSDYFSGNIEENEVHDVVLSKDEELKLFTALRRNAMDLERQSARDGARKREKRKAHIKYVLVGE